MDQEIDEIVVPSIGKYNETDLKSVNYSDAADDLKTDKDKKEDQKKKPQTKVKSFST